MITLDSGADFPTNDTFLWALISDNLPEKVVFDLNNKLSIHLHRAADILNPLVKTEQRFLHFEYQPKQQEQKLWLVSNRAYQTTYSKEEAPGLFAERLEEKPLLMPSLATYNYFLIVKGALTEMDLQKLNQDLRGTPSLRTAESVDLTLIKNIENLIYPEYANKQSKDSIDLRARLRRL